MNKLLLILCLSIFLHSSPFEGLTLITGLNDNYSYTHLINNDNNIINSWSHDVDMLASISYLSSDSILFVPSKSNFFDPIHNLAAVGGNFKKLNWDGDVIWDYTLPDSICIPHHDIEILPNGNILAICSEIKSEYELANKGKINNETIMVIDMIVEIEPQENNQANIVWEWRFWDRLIQDIYPNLENYNSILDNYGKLDINCSLQGDPTYQMLDWNHCNSISYNSDLDQIMLSSRRFNEIYIIDHSTTTEEAETDFGGRYNKGGDFLYRWGNPQNFKYEGLNSVQRLYNPHAANWIPNGYTGAGNILIFNNNHIQHSNSAVVEIEPPLDNQGNYLIGDIYGPLDFEWVYQSDFFSGFQSGAYRLPNGNTIITSTNDNRIFEIDSEGIIQWNYSGNLTHVPRALKFYNNLTNYESGDFNNDGIIDILDIIQIVGFVLENEYDSTIDFNNDGIIDVLDIVQLINIILD